MDPEDTAGGYEFTGVPQDVLVALGEVVVAGSRVEGLVHRLAVELGKDARKQLFGASCDALQAAVDAREWQELDPERLRR